MNYLLPMKTSMVNVGDKKKTRRFARAEGFVRMDPEIIGKIRKNLIPKGNVLESARIAAILAAKNTANIIPLCHNIALEYAGVDFLLKRDRIRVESSVRATAKTGVEMEAMVSCSVACLTIYDMCKFFSKDIVIEKIVLLEKMGGKSGIYRRGMK